MIHSQGAEQSCNTLEENRAELEQPCWENPPLLVTLALGKPFLERGL